MELTCTIKNGKDYPILWMRLQSEHNKNALPISNGENMIFKDRRFAVDYDSDAGSYKLTIKEVVKSDEGKYQCQGLFVYNLVSYLLTPSDIISKIKIILDY